MNCGEKIRDKKPAKNANRKRLTDLNSLNRCSRAKRKPFQRLTRLRYSKDAIGIRQQLAGLSSKLRDPRFAFLFKPGDWLPDIEGKTPKDLDALLQDWIGGPQPITILDLSGIPADSKGQFLAQNIKGHYRYARV